MKKKLVVLFIFVFNFCFSQAQTLKKSELRKLSTFGINLNSANLDDQSKYLNLIHLLKAERKRKKNKCVGIILTSFSALSTLYGTRIISNAKGGDAEPFGNIIGGVFIGFGVVNAGISVPLFIAANKHKKERNRLISLYN